MNPLNGIKIVISTVVAMKDTGDGKRTNPIKDNRLHDISFRNNNSELLALVNLPFCSCEPLDYLLKASMSTDESFRLKCSIDNQLVGLLG